MKLVPDTMVLLNFARAERLELLNTLAPHVGRLVVQEMKYWPIGTLRARTTFDLKTALPAAVVISLETNEELDRFRQFRELGLGGGEAECVALASCRSGMVAATDDETARNIVAREMPQLQISSTIRVLGHLMEAGELAPDEAQAVLRTMRARGARLPDIPLGPERLTNSPRWSGNPQQRARSAAFVVLSKAVPPVLQPVSLRRHRQR